MATYDKGKTLVIDPILAYSTYLGGSQSDTSRSIAVDGFGNVYVTGSTKSFDFPIANPIQSTNSGGCCGFDEEVFVTKVSANGSNLVYSTYLGGPGNDFGYDIAVDNAGNAYVTGETYSRNFPTVNPIQLSVGPATNAVIDAFVFKLNASGSALIYSTYLGGDYYDHGRGIAVDSEGNSYVTGYTASNNFPLVNPFKSTHKCMTFCSAYQAFVTKINAEGSALVYSTFLGGTGIWDDRALAIAIDSERNAYVTGYTWSTDFTTINSLVTHSGFQLDAFVTKLDATGSALVYSTYLGGTSHDVGNSIAVDSMGNAYVTGYTLSDDFPVTNPLQSTRRQNSDAFLSKLNVDGSALAYSTYLGGNVNEEGIGIAVDGVGNAYVTGITSSSNFPTVNSLQSNGLFNDAFISKLNAAGSTLIYSTYLGGSSSSEGHDIAVDNTEQQAKIETAAQLVLDARASEENRCVEQGQSCSLAALYASGNMPTGLLKAHNQLDKAVDATYGYKPVLSKVEGAAPSHAEGSGKDDATRVAYLFERYRALLEI